MVTIGMCHLNDKSTANNTSLKMLVWTPDSTLSPSYNHHSSNLLAFPDNHLRTRNKNSPILAVRSFASLFIKKSKISSHIVIGIKRV